MPAFNSTSQYFGAIKLEVKNAIFLLFDLGRRQFTNVEICTITNY
jgi:hypothetical protein